MSTRDSDMSPEELQKRLRDMLKDSHLGFTGGPFATPGKPSGESQPDEAQARTEEALRRIRQFSFKPREVRDYLDRFVVKQDEAKKVLAVAICDHYNHVRRCIEHPTFREREYAKQNVILLGPTGVGKTYLVRCIAKLIGVKNRPLRYPVFRVNYLFRSTTTIFAGFSLFGMVG